jgi:hypothetical protein
MSQSKSLTAIALMCLSFAAGTVARAQEEARDACVDACHEAKAQCIGTCDTRDNPVECDEACQETAQDCIEACG